jgi:hypothetical protein
VKKKIPCSNSPKKLIFLRFGIVALTLLLIWWILLRRVYFEDGMRISLKSQGRERAVTFVVEGPDGKPAPGVTVSVVNTSGNDGNLQTDEHGVAVSPQDETEIVSVWIDDTYCEFSKIPLIDALFRPDCATGLTVEVKLEHHP